MSLWFFLLSQLTHYTTQLWTFHQTPHTNTLSHKGFHSGLMVCWVCEEKVRGGPDLCVCLCVSALVALTHSLEQMCCCCSGGCHFLLLACEDGQLLSKGPTSAWSLTSAPPRRGPGQGTARWGLPGCVCRGVFMSLEYWLLLFGGETCGVCVCMWGIRAGGWVMEGGYRRNTWLRKTVAREGCQKCFGKVQSSRLLTWF